MSEHLAVLNLHVSDLNAASVRKAYRTESLKWHPDKPNGNATKFRQVRAAYEFLRDPVNLSNILEAASVRQRYANIRQRVTQEMTREVLRKERMAERLKVKEREAAWRQQEVSSASQNMREKFRAGASQDRPHRYPSNYQPSSDEDSSSSSQSEVIESLRLAAMRSMVSRPPSVLMRKSGTSALSQHLVVDLSDSSLDGA